MRGWMQVPFTRYWNWIADPFSSLLQALLIKGSSNSNLI
ncbi:hypothetical protein EV06_1911 [Prochlorococcus sp. MIT 0602]|nr:hypothetical protein EV06_1911 [Prochlorococcus sp. MIT 0602]KGG15719.1 hypothetical protein EV07_1684 [Prochlorococcus sp. MIT 0603]